MNSGDDEMMEADVPPAQSAGNYSTSGSDDVKNLLLIARELIDQGKPSQALQAVMLATKLRGGDDAVSQVISRARSLYLNKAQASAAADELARVFAECAIAEAIHPEQSMASLVSAPDPKGGSSILAESGRQQIVMDAFSDGSSFICLRCGGLISNLRKDEHFANWCREI